MKTDEERIFFQVKQELKYPSVSPTKSQYSLSKNYKDDFLMEFSLSFVTFWCFISTLIMHKCSNVLLNNKNNKGK